MADIDELLYAKVLEWSATHETKVQEPRKDRFGWDCLIELAMTGGPFAHVSLDERPARPRAHLQLKSVSKGAKSGRFPTRISVKLSVWEELTNNALPCFFLIGCYERAVLSAAFLVHVDEPWIERTKRRLRQLEAEGRRDPQNAWLDLVWREDEALALTSDDFHTRLWAAIDNPDQYIVKKNAIRNEVGYGPNPLKVRVSVPLADLEKFAIGRSNELPAEVKAMHRLRFDIPLPVSASELAKIQDARVLQHPPRHGVLRIRSGNEMAQAEVRIHAHPVGEILAPDVPSARLEAGAFEILFTRNGTAHVRGPLEPGGRASLRMLREAAAFLAVAQRPRGRAGSLLTLDIGGVPSLPARLSRVNFPGEMVALRRLCDDAIALCGMAALQDTHLPLSVLIGQAEDVAELAACRVGQRRTGSLSMTLEGNEPTDLAPNAHLCIVRGHLLSLGEHDVCVVTTSQGYGPISLRDHKLQCTDLPMTITTRAARAASPGSWDDERVTSFVSEVGEPFDTGSGVFLTLTGFGTTSSYQAERSRTGS